MVSRTQAAKGSHTRFQFSGARRWPFLWAKAKPLFASFVETPAFACPVFLAATLDNAGPANTLGDSPDSSEGTADNSENSKGTPTPTAVSNSLKACRHSAQPARCACSFFCSSSVRSPEVETAHSSRNSSCVLIPNQSSASRFLLEFPMLFRNPHSNPKHFFPQPIQSPVVVVPHISSWLS